MSVFDLVELPSLCGEVLSYCKRWARKVSVPGLDPEELYQEAVLDLLIDPPVAPEGGVTIEMLEALLRHRVKVVACRLTTKERRRHEVLLRALRQGDLRPGLLAGGRARGSPFGEDYGEDQSTPLEVVEDVVRDPGLRSVVQDEGRLARVRSARDARSDHRLSERDRMRIYREPNTPDDALLSAVHGCGFTTIESCAAAVFGIPA